MRVYVCVCVYVFEYERIGHVFDNIFDFLVRSGARTRNACRSWTDLARSTVDGASGALGASAREPAVQVSRSSSGNAITRSQRTAGSSASVKDADIRFATPIRVRRKRPASEQSSAAITTAKNTKGRITPGCRISIKVSHQFLDLLSFKDASEI